ncbi:unnamed protein product [Arctogadus glacialis]
MVDICQRLGRELGTMRTSRVQRSHLQRLYWLSSAQCLTRTLTREEEDWKIGNLAKRTMAASKTLTTAEADQDAFHLQDQGDGLIVPAGTPTIHEPNLIS